MKLRKETERLREDILSGTLPTVGPTWFGLGPNLTLTVRGRHLSPLPRCVPHLCRSSLFRFAVEEHCDPNSNSLASVLLLVA